MAGKNFKDPRGKHVRLYNELLNSPAFIALNWSTQAIYVRIRAQLGGANNGDISATLSTLKPYGVNSSVTLANALHDLQTLGFIDKTRQGGVANGGKNCCLYRFTDEDCHEIPKKGIKSQKATFDYLQYKTMQEAQAALIASRDENAVKSQQRKNKVKVQNLNVVGSENELSKPKLRSVSEHGAA